MGKSLIIKGADFSGVSVPEYIISWFINENAVEKTASSVINAGRFVPKSFSNVQGRTINAIKITLINPGIVTIAVASSLNSDAVFTQERQLDFSDSPVGDVIKIFSPIEIPNDGYICIQKSTDTGLFGYNDRQGGGFYGRVGQAGGPIDLSVASLGVNFGVAELVE